MDWRQRNPIMHTKTTLKSLAVLLPLLAGSALLAGPLDPPPGPIGTSFKTLSETEPRIAINATNTPPALSSIYRITQPGSYYLTGNITGASGKVGIEVSASNVSIDLNGFSVTGVAGSLSGISGGVQSNISIRNGTVRSWGSLGVNLVSATGGRIEDLSLIGNGLDGIACAAGSVVERCIARNNGASGIETGVASEVRGCVSELNATGFYLDNGASASDCTAAYNTGDGFYSTDGGVLTECNASANGDDGIAVNWACAVTRCTSNSNDGDGISLGSYCRIADNYVRGNDGPGIHAVLGANRSRITGNTSVQNAIGVHVESPSNFITGNSCTESDTVNFNIAANNRVGAIVTLPLSGAINGNVGGTANAADEISNFAY